MLIKKSDDVKSSEITSESTYLNRRNFIRGAALIATTTATGWLYRTLNRAGLERPAETGAAKPQEIARYATPNGEAANTFEEIANYNNFYEFSTNKQAVAVKARNFVTRPWTVDVTGLVGKPKTFDLDDLLKLAPQEDRIYRLRCVEAWSMVIPWLGFPLAKLLAAVEPLSTAKYVQFQTLFDPDRMPNQRGEVLPWPYFEGLRMDEAMHPLTILSSGLYGKPLPAQNGAPL
ncbi:MAG: protein-methionine-sulfoxide reductase catalytic subunit MsrP, partial [Blastocatellia bacterium]